jgi:hypothetical protein
MDAVARDEHVAVTAGDPTGSVNGVPLYPIVGTGVTE